MEPEPFLKVSRLPWMANSNVNRHVLQILAEGKSAPNIFLELFLGTVLPAAGFGF